ncbi:penicillin-binding protein 2B [Gracilibacillus ureilyticus]|uniref:serine-type D-Ala-D-Ala carboxypeptidase n=1 Tax=Gracilibacillus ureilyticus TaxID=531814 RepID=A0A1H9KXC2_9BACI|nr:penicillin-binding transpeptidase domain-containing protein [Gracilibacillus ureilyticus]SER03796.1 penicillin-binding protein 2B [Gracilibacillus ureilyticus]
MRLKFDKFLPVFWIGIFAVAFLIIIGRFLVIQVTGEVSGVDIKALADEKRTNEYSIPAQRGSILDRNGMPLAQEHTVYRVYAVLDESYTSDPLTPKHVTDAGKTAAKLAPVLGMEESEISAILSKGMENNKFQVEFGKNGKELTQQEKEEIESLKLPGIYFEEEAIRFYPNGMFASHTLGLTDKKEGVIAGISGVESYYNDILTGVDGHISYQRDKFNVKLLDPKEVVQEPENGDNVVLTLDQKIQTLLEDSLTEVVEQYNPSRISAVVMNAKTGEILAMGNRPSYNPNNLSSVENWYNDVISTPFEPGSTMKIFTLAAAIEEGVWNPNDTFQSGSYKAGENIQKINDHNWGRGWGTISYLEGIQRSSNVAAAKLAYEKIGPAKFLEYLQAFDFDTETGIDLSGEVAGVIQYNYAIEQITTSFGQGTTTTPMQLMKAATAVANNGKMLKPYIIKEITDSDTGKVLQEGQTEVVGEPISSETAKETLRVLETVITSEKGTGYNKYKLDGYSLAGKTGTAQIPNSETGGYMTGRENYVFSFLGMAPADDPELIMYVSVKQPELEDTEPDSAPVSFIFNNVMENSLRYLNIETDEEKTPSIPIVQVPEWQGRTTQDVVASFQKLGIPTEVIGDGENVASINVEQGTEITSHQKVLILTDAPKMPDLTGWALRDVLSLQDLIGFEVNWSGEGYVVTQDLKQGAAISSADVVTVELSSE